MLLYKGLEIETNEAKKLVLHSYISRAFHAFIAVRNKCQATCSLIWALTSLQKHVCTNTMFRYM